MELPSIIGRLIGGYACHIAGAIGAAIVASEFIVPLQQASSTVQHVLP